MYCAPQEYSQRMLLKGGRFEFRITESRLELISDIVYILNFIGALASIIMFIESRVERFYDKRKK